MSGFCNNCGKYGHPFHNCKSPICSYGIIAYNIDSNNNLTYLMICRKNSLGFVDFIRGKYNLNNINYIQTLIDEMTIDEKKSICTYAFDALWCDLWGHDTSGFHYEHRASRNKFNFLRRGVFNKTERIELKDLCLNSSTQWLYPEWGFPKGRRNNSEGDFDCALREWEEETGYSKKTLSLLNNIIPYEEIFTGSNYKSYKHKYYVAEIYAKHIPSVVSFQISEVSDIKWVSYDECVNTIRTYNIEKINIIKHVNATLTNYKIISI